MSVDPVEANPHHYSVIFENDRVRVLHYQDGPGDRTEPHEHPDTVMISLSGLERRLNGDGDVRISADEVHWLDAQEHASESIGTTALFVELKEGRSQESDHPVLPALGPSDDPNAGGNRPSPSSLSD
jgi:beta-alanine degradation protein BauB